MLAQLHSPDSAFAPARLAAGLGLGLLLAASAAFAAEPVPPGAVGVDSSSAAPAANAAPVGSPPAATAATWNPPPPAEVSTVIGTTLVSQYLYRGERLGAASLQSWVEVDAGNFGIGVWTDFPLADSGNPPHQSNPEIDPYAYYRIALSDRLSLIPAFQVDTYPKSDVGSVSIPGYFRTRAEPSLALDYRIGGVTLEPKVAYDFTLKGATWELTGLYAVPVASVGSEIDLKAMGGWFDYADGLIHASAAARAQGGYWLAGAEVPFQLSRRGRLTVGWAYAQGFRNTLQAGAAPRTANPLAAARGVFSVAYAWTF